MLHLLEACLPGGRDIFRNYEPYGIARLFHLNGYVMEKTFVYAIFCLSKWLTKEYFPHGFYGQWPPELPEDQKPKPPAAAVVDVP